MKRLSAVAILFAALCSSSLAAGASKATYYVPACQAGGGMCYSAGSAGCSSCCRSVGYLSGYCTGRAWGDTCYCVT
jgi:hypothetical protein